MFSFCDILKLNISVIQLNVKTMEAQSLYVRLRLEGVGSLELREFATYVVDESGKKYGTGSYRCDVIAGDGEDERFLCWMHILSVTPSLKTIHTKECNAFFVQEKDGRRLDYLVLSKNLSSWKCRFYSTQE